MSEGKTKKLEHEAEGGAGGAVAGAILGAVAGPPGAVVGAILGAAAGALAGLAIDRGTTENEAVDAGLDEAIGVSGGEMGAPNLEHPPATRGAFSGASAGVAPAADGEPAEGPIPSPSS